MIKHLICWFVLTTIICSHALGFGGAGSSNDPYYLVPIQNYVTVPRNSLTPYGHAFRGGYTQQNCSASLGLRKVAVFVGQSVTAASVDGLYTPTQANNWQFDVTSGNCYTMRDPPLGPSVSPINAGSYSAQVGDILIASTFAQHFITMNIAVGGTVVANWAAGGFLNDSIAVAGRRLLDAGLTCTHIIWGQGETDNQIGTSQAAYTASLNSVISSFRSAGMSCPFIVLIETMISGVTSASIQAAQNAATGTNVFVGFDMDAGVPNSGGNRYDGTHLSASSGRALAANGVAGSIAAH